MRGQFNAQKTGFHYRTHFFSPIDKSRTDGKIAQAWLEYLTETGESAGTWGTFIPEWAHSVTNQNVHSAIRYNSGGIGQWSISITTPKANQCSESTEINHLNVWFNVFTIPDPDEYFRRRMSKKAEDLIRLN